MAAKRTALTSGVLALLVPAVFGFSNDGSPVSRSLAPSVALTNSLVTVTVTATNAGSNTWRGFWYADQVPSALVVCPLEVTLNGRAVTNYTFETGQDGDVCPGCTPHRCVLETPPALAETNPVPPRSAVRIVFTISSSSPGAFNLEQFQWVGYDSSQSNAVFGCSESADRMTVNFLSAPVSPPLLAGQLSTNGLRLDLAGLGGASYVIQASTNLSQWQPLVTNTAPFSFTDTASDALTHRFYRGLWRP
jgi:hypothetical protein